MLYKRLINNILIKFLMIFTFRFRVDARLSRDLFIMRIIVKILISELAHFFIFVIFVFISFVFVVVVSFAFALVILVFVIFIIVVVIIIIIIIIVVAIAFASFSLYYK